MHNHHRRQSFGEVRSRIPDSCLRLCRRRTLGPARQVTKVSPAVTPLLRCMNLRNIRVGMRAISRTEIMEFDLLMAATVLPMMILDVVLAKLVHLNAGQELRTMLSLSLGSVGLWILIAACAYCRWRGMTRMADLTQVLAWSLLVAPAISFLIPVAGRSPYPLVDGVLSRIDAGMHFHTVSIVHLFARWQHLQHALYIAYALLWVLVVASLLIPTLGGRGIDSRRYVFAVLIASVITAILFAFWPAAGPWTVQSFAPTSDQAEVIGALAALKSGQPLPEGVKSAVVAFPSFHVVLAVLSIIALWNIRWVRWFGFVFGAMICVSTITTGWHYGIDVIAGFLVTYVAQEIACLVLRPLPSKVAGTDRVATGAGQEILSNT